MWKHFSKQFSSISDFSALHGRHSLRCRQVLLPAWQTHYINLRFSPTLSFMAYLSLMTASRVTSLSTSALVFTAIKDPQISEKPIELWGTDFWKIQSKHCNGEVLPADVRRQNADNTTSPNPEKWHFRPFMLPLPAFSTPSLLAHICITIQKENHKGALA